jgi:two-component sensor histidine kinase
MQPEAISIELRDLPVSASVRDPSGKIIWPAEHTVDEDHTPAKGIDIAVLTDLLMPAVLHVQSTPNSPIDLLMLHEAQHRARNLVSLIISLAHQSLEPLSHEQAVVSFIDRLRSLDAVAQIGCEVDGDMCDLGAITRRIVSRMDDPAHPHVRLEGPHVVVAARWAHLIAIITHELVANAVRHGALSVAEGRVDLRWSLTHPDDEPSVLHLGWRERHGRPPARTLRSGFGMKVLRHLPGLSKRVRSSHRFEAGGVTYDLWLELSGSEVRYLG